MGRLVMKVLIEPGHSKNLLTTIAIGEDYYDSWKAYAFPGWAKYCRRHGLGLVVFGENLIGGKHKFWKKATWQKLLIGEILKRSQFKVENVCYLDTDILISPMAPNIFEFYYSEAIGLVSKRKNLPFPYESMLRRLAFLRHACYDKRYPLDSSLFMSLKQLYEYHGLPVQSDEACMGLIVFNVPKHADIMRGWFEKYERNVQSVTNGGDQTHVNYEMQNWGNIQWLDYRFQAIWAFEMAWKYPFLYEFFRENSDLIRKCIEASLYANYFLHFAGSWYESDMWKIKGVFDGDEKKLLQDYSFYLDMLVTGDPKGMIRPNKPI